MTGFASWLQDIRPDPDEGITLDQALAGHSGRSWWDSDSKAPDPGDEDARRDDHATGLLVRRYQPGITLDLARRLGDAEAELAGERAALDREARRDERVRRMLEKGEIRALDVARMDDGEGDPARAAKLERRCESLRQQIAAAAERITPQGPAIEENAVESAQRRARLAAAELAEASREAAAEARQSRSQEPRPFAGRGAEDAPDCPHCAAMIASGQASRSECEAICTRTAPEMTRDAYHVIGAYDAGEIVRGTEGAIMGVQ
jgi:hypothetical protein